MDKKTIRLKFADSGSTTREQRAIQPTAVSPTTAPRPKPVVVRTEQLAAKCGHAAAFEVLAKDLYTDERRAKHRARDCKACIAARILHEQEGAKAKKSERKSRLPNGSVFNVEYDAVAVRWKGSLTTSIDGETETFAGEATAVFQLLRKLDHAYRKRTPIPTLPSQTIGGSS